MALTIIEEHKSFNGSVYYFQHQSDVCHSSMTFSVYLPPEAKLKKVPAVFWLSGLTCNHENFITKAGATYYASQLGIALIMPDTSPRNLPISEAQQGYGAGFYVNAEIAPFNKYFNMYDYILQELPNVCEQNLPIIPKHYSIMGHSMGGHGALVLALRNPSMYQSVSAFAPICAPSKSIWGRDYFSLYLGKDEKKWQQYDATALIQSTPVRQELFIDQGTDDQFLQHQLMPEDLIIMCKQHNHPLNFRYQQGYDHSYYFIASFIGEHLQYHANRLKNEP